MEGVHINRREGGFNIQRIPVYCTKQEEKKHVSSMNHFHRYDLLTENEYDISLFRMSPSHIRIMCMLCV